MYKNPIQLLPPTNSQKRLTKMHGRFLRSRVAWHVWCPSLREDNGGYYQRRNKKSGQRARETWQFNFVLKLCYKPDGIYRQYGTERTGTSSARNAARTFPPPSNSIEDEEALHI